SGSAAWGGRAQSRRYGGQEHRRRMAAVRRSTLTAGDCSLMRKHSVLICVVISVMFLVTATVLYPGGSILDHNSVGFDWSRNFFSNLFLATALNGAANPSRIWALIGMAFNSIGYGLFFIHTSRKIPHKHTQVVLMSIGVVNMLFTFLVATRLHDSMVTVS